MPVTACELLYDRVLPFYEQLGVPVGAILTDNGREFCGKAEQHPYELLLAMEGIEHRTTRVRSPRTNGFVEHMNRTLLDECFRVSGRTTWYLELAEIQRDLDTFLTYYNLDLGRMLETEDTQWVFAVAHGTFSHGDPSARTRRDVSYMRH
jgi:transposase InsO family protein